MGVNKGVGSGTATAVSSVESLLRASASESTVWPCLSRVVKGAISVWVKLGALGEGRVGLRISSSNSRPMEIADRVREQDLWAGSVASTGAEAVWATFLGEVVDILRDVSAGGVAGTSMETVWATFLGEVVNVPPDASTVCFGCVA